METYMINAELLRQRIEETGLSYSKIAELAGISRNTLYKIVKQEHNPSVDTICCLTVILNLTQKDFQAIFFPKITLKKEPVING